MLFVRRDALLFPPPAGQGSASTSSNNVLCYSYGETLYCSHYQQCGEAHGRNSPVFFAASGKLHTHCKLSSITFPFWNKRKLRKFILFWIYLVSSQAAIFYWVNIGPTYDYNIGQIFMTDILGQYSILENLVDNGNICWPDDNIIINPMSTNYRVNNFVILTWFPK